jgi:hypothetical protein
MSGRIVRAEFESENEARIDLAELRSAGLVQSPWFGFGVAALFVVLAFAFEPQRAWLFGIAGIAAYLGFIDWAGGSEWD